MEVNMTQADLVAVIGWVGTVFACLLWFTFVDQIRLNLRGQKGSWVVASAVVINCITWVAYGLLSSPQVWPIVVANAPGIVLGFVAAITAIRK
jgi:uncharacterized protein with PQ loop repeat